MAKLYFRYGAMNCGKTSILMQVAHNYEEQGMNILVMKPSIDTKGDEKIVSRIGLERKVDHLIEPDENIKDYLETKNNINCILVDEAQFLNPQQVDELMDIVVEKEIPVICYGLRTDFKTKGFPGSTRLLEIAHTIEELKTICTCGKKALYNARYINNEFTQDGNQVAIDGKDFVTYKAMCPECFYKEKAKIKRRGEM